MFIIFTKKHPVGIAKGHSAKIADKAAEEFLEGKFAKEISEEEYNEWLKSFREKRDEDAEKLISESKESLKKDKEEIRRDRIVQMEAFEGFYDREKLTLDLNQGEFAKLMIEAEANKSKDESETKSHKDGIHAMSIVDLEKYIKENDLTVTFDKNDSQEDVATLVLLAEEEKANKKKVED